MIRIIQGNSVIKLKELPESSIHCIVTSPPYFGLRSYLPEGHPNKADEIGLENTPDQYIGKLVQVFREIRRVLHPTGVVFLNLGDNYNSSTQFNQRSDDLGKAERYAESETRDDYPGHRALIEGLKPKDLIGIPWSVAFALRNDGWWLRSDMIWAKGISCCAEYSGSCMPESVKDRPVKSHEYVFLLTKNEKYFYDQMAVAEKASYAEQHAKKATSWGMNRKHPNKNNVENYAFAGDNHTTLPGGKRNLRSVLAINPEPTSIAHFATMPSKLAQLCIMAGTSEKGCCPKCLNPWKRVVDIQRTATRPGQDCKPSNGKACDKPGQRGNPDAKYRIVSTVNTVGWEPTCSCEAENIIPCTVLDPFGGSGTTGQAADAVGRNAILIELNPEYLDIIYKRTAKRNMFTGV